MVMELKVMLDFACCACDHPMNVALKCEGKGLLAGSQVVAAVKIPCPNCQQVNQLVFEPHQGSVRCVTPCLQFFDRLEPSLN